MIVERYGSTSLQVSKICYGTGLTGRLRFKRTPAEGGRLFRYAHERGITFGIRPMVTGRTRMSLRVCKVWNVAR